MRLALTYQTNKTVIPSPKDEAPLHKNYILMKISITLIVLIIVFSTQAFAQGDLRVKGKIRSDSLANQNYLIIYADSTGTLDTLPAGLPGQVLISNGQGGKPYWGMSGGGDSILYADFTQVGTDANTLEKVLASYTLPANILNTNGMGIKIHAFGSSSGNNFILRLRFGNWVHQCMFGGNINPIWSYNAEIYRNASNNQKGTSIYAESSLAACWLLINANENLTNNILIQITGQNTVASVNDIVLEGIVIKLIR